MDNFIKTAYDRGVAQALSEFGLLREKTAGSVDVLKALSGAARANNLAPAAMGLGGAGLGALAGGEGNRLSGAALGGLAGYTGGRLGRSSFRRGIDTLMKQPASRFQTGTFRGDLLAEAGSKANMSARQLKGYETLKAMNPEQFNRMMLDSGGMAGGIGGGLLGIGAGTGAAALALRD